MEAPGNWDDCEATFMEGALLAEGGSPAQGTAVATGAPARRLRAKLGRFAWETGKTVALALMIFFITHSAVEGREIEGPSMEPTFHGGQRVLVNRVVYSRLDPRNWLSWLPGVGNRSESATSRYVFHAPDRGDVIIFEPPFANRADLIKRVIGVPGDHVVVRDGKVMVNGQVVDESYLPSSLRTSCGGQWCDVTLGPGEFYVMGDNRPRSSDSRLWGPVKSDQVIGKAWLVFAPVSDFGVAK